VSEDTRIESVALAQLLVGTLGTWRVTHLLQAEDGPWGLVARLRGRVGHAFWSELLDCFNCLSLWTGGAFAYTLGKDGRERVMLWPALSAGAILIERMTTPPAAYVEDQGEEDVLWGPQAAVARN
jgi:hypothetical protein